MEDFKKLNNKYFKGYWFLINKAFNRILEANIYKEDHHIYPKSIFGENDYIVFLTGREHFLIHKMLWLGFRKEFGTKDKRTISMAYAFHCMRMTNKNHKRYKIEYSKDYELLKIANTEANSEYYSDPEIRAKIGEQSKENWKDPKYRENLSKKT